MPKEETIATLIDAGADVNCVARFAVLDHLRRGFDFVASAAGRGQQSTPLIVNVVRCNVKNVKMLVDNGAADVNLADCSGMTPLMHAAKTNSIIIVKAILTADNIDVTLCDTKGWNAIHHCIALGNDDEDPLATFDNVTLFETLIKAGVEVKLSAFELASKTGATKILEKISKILKIKKVNDFLTKY